MKLYFVRHGESEANVQGVFSNRGWQHGLTEKGRRQARTLAGKICASVLKIYCSPLMRAVQTAEILAAAWGVEYEAADALREFDCGALENMPMDEARWSQHKAAMADWLIHRRWDSRVAGGESFFDIRARFVPWIEQLVQKHGKQDVSLVCVGHGGTYRAMLPQVLQNISDEFIIDHSLGNTEYVLAGITPTGRLVCLEWCGAAIGTERDMRNHGPSAPRESPWAAM